MILIEEDNNHTINYASLQEFILPKKYTDPTFILLADIMWILQHYPTDSCRLSHILYHGIFSNNLVDFVRKHLR